MSAPGAERMLDVFLNYACQAKCPFCFNPPLTPELVRWRLPLERLAAELLRARRNGFTGVTFSGGEVTLLKDLPKMLRLARKAGYGRAGIISNGLRLGEAGYVGELAEAGLGFCCLSIHGARAEVHDRMVAVPGAFDKAVAALGHLRARGIPAVLNFVLTRGNVAEAAAMAGRFAGEPGVAEIQLYFPHYDGLMAAHAGSLGLSLPEAVAVLPSALAAAERAGGGEKLWFYNFPPCAAPELSGRMRNWEREEDALLIDPQGHGEGDFAAERRTRRRPAACGECRLGERCLGPESGYVERFGDGDIRALR